MTVRDPGQQRCRVFARLPSAGGGFDGADPSIPWLQFGQVRSI